MTRITMPLPIASPLNENIYTIKNTKLIVCFILLPSTVLASVLDVRQTGERPLQVQRQ